jgi:dihydroorotate dehydrogenase electron transfer subunit
MRRPMSIMRANKTAGWIDILYKIHGFGTELLSQKRSGNTVNLLGPIGAPFKLEGYRRRPLLIGGGVGIPPMVFLAEHMKKMAATLVPLALMGSEVPFPFKRRPSRFMIPGIPASVIAAMPLLEDWGLPSRLASLKGFPGCFEGFVTDLARGWLDAQRPEHRLEVEIFACGPTPMLKAVARLAKDYELPCQISLEEYMACAVGGCAGCVVQVLTETGPAMKRVCVDGPVFEAATVMF